MNLIQLQPDDVLVVSHPSYLSTSQRDAMVEILRQALGQSQRVLIIDAGQSLGVLRGVAAEDQAKDDDQRATWRREYNALSPADREQYGSFMGYVADQGGRDPYARQEQHVDTDEPEAEGIPPHVWLYRNMLTDLQAVAPLGRDETNGQYAVAIDQLTDEQRAIPHVSRQLPGDVLTGAVDAGVRIEENGIIRRNVQKDAG